LNWARGTRREARGRGKGLGSGQNEARTGTVRQPAGKDACLTGKGGENVSLGKGCNPSFAGVFKLLPTNQGANQGLGTSAFFMSTTSPRPSPPLKRGGEGAKGWRSGKVFGHRQTSAAWFVGVKNQLLVGWGLRPRTGALRGLGNSDRFLTGRASNAVITTFITGDFSRGPWTSAVQGPKYLKYFLGQASNCTETF